MTACRTQVTAVQTHNMPLDILRALTTRLASCCWHSSCRWPWL